MLTLEALRHVTSFLTETLHHIYCCYVTTVYDPVLDACCQQAFHIYIKSNACKNVSARFLCTNFIFDISGL